MKRKRTSSIALLLLAVAAVFLTACGGGANEPTSQQPETGTDSLRQVTVAIPFPSGIAFYPLFVAKEMGYFAEEGLEVSVVPLDGSSNVYKQVMADQADFGFPSPPPIIDGRAQGHDARAVYTMYQGFVFQVVSLEGSPYRTLDDLRGQTIGVGSEAGSEAAFIRALLADKGFTEGEDYQIVEVGDGGAASVSLRQERVAAYASAFIDMAIMRLRGVDLQYVEIGSAGDLFDAVLFTKDQTIQSDPELVIGMGRALAKGTLFGFENPEAAVKLGGRSFPEEIEDMEFAMAVMEETIALFKTPSGVGIGHNVPAKWQAYVDYMQFREETTGPVVVDDLFTNEFIDAFNDFDHDAVAADARSFEE